MVRRSRHRDPFRLPVLLLAAALAATPSPGQEWRGANRAAGVVLDADGDPLAGARVTLRRLEPPHDGPEPVETGRRGRWSIAGLAGGVWRIDVEAGGFVVSRGRIAVPASGPARPVRVRLRPLAEVSPLASEGNPNTVLGWIERGDSLLAQERPAEARAEYEKALAELPAEERPRVLQAVARTHWLEGDVDRALERLREAVRLAPGDAGLRELTAEVGRASGREEEVAAFLEELPAATPTAPEPAGPASPADPAPSGAFRLPERPRVDPVPHRTGPYRTWFGDSGELSSIDTFVERTGIPLDAVRAEDPGAGELELDRETFEVYVPAAYRPETPYGLFVWVSPTPYGGFSRSETAAVLDRLRLISVGANRSGNDRPKWDRFALALEAARHVRALYAVDPRRVYVGGYSGGGRIASGLALLYPEVFRGGFFLFGCDLYRDLPVPDRPGARWPARFRRPPRATLRALKGEHRFVLLTGELDFNRMQTRATREALRRDGFEHVTYLEIPGAGHYTIVGPEWLERGFAALDAPLGPPADRDAN